LPQGCANFGIGTLAQRTDGLHRMLMFAAERSSSRAQHDPHLA
jgi:hypothetical protein